jgi:hypothetical protein
LLDVGARKRADGLLDFSDVAAHFETVSQIA